MTQVKICGLKEITHALAAARAGSNFIGLVFAASQRQVTLAQAQEIASVIKEHSSTIEIVGVFVNIPAPAINRLAHACNLDWVQLSGDEPWEYCSEITKPLIKAIRVSRRQGPQEICAALANKAKVISQKHIYLLDSRVKGKYGGTGTAFDWNLARQAAEQFPVIIAGGLTPENVTQVIKIAAPWGVDVSSGVEVGGVKHTARIRAFIEAVRRADEK